MACKLLFRDSSGSLVLSFGGRERKRVNSLACLASYWIHSNAALIIRGWKHWARCLLLIWKYTLVPLPKMTCGPNTSCGGMPVVRLPCPTGQPGGRSGSRGSIQGFFWFFFLTEKPSSTSSRKRRRTPPFLARELPQAAVTYTGALGLNSSVTS